MRACAIMWDFDGTLVDSRHRNLSVNRSIVERLTGRTWADFKALTSVSEYDAAVARCTNWRDFYEREFELRGLQIESAGRLWTEYQLRDGTPVPPFEGVTEALDALAHLPQGIVSQNARDIITATLGTIGLGDRFRHVVGYEEVGPGRQKPAPDGLLDCLAVLTDFAPGTACYVGDHPTDAQCAAEARRELGARGLDIEVLSIAVLYGGGTPGDWVVPPDATVRTPAEIVDVVSDHTACRNNGPGRSGTRARSVRLQDPV